MSTFLKKFYFITLLCQVMFFTSCDKEKSPPSSSDCAIKAFYRGTNVCHNGEYSAAIQIESNNKYLILENFFEFLEVGSIQYDDIVYVDFEEVDLNEISPALCGMSIVAPVSNLTCISNR